MTDYFPRQDRVRGAALVVGVGAIGGPLAEELVHLGLDRIFMVDPDTFKPENFARHPLLALAAGLNKAEALAEQLRAKIPDCDARGVPTDFLDLTDDAQRWLVGNADVVIDATGALDCQRRINRLCLEARKPAIYLGMWVDRGAIRSVRDAEVGEILWVDPRQHTPCWHCAYGRRETAEVRAWRGARADIKIVVLVAANVVAGLLRPDSDYARMLDRRRTCIWVHTFTPLSEGVAPVFDRMPGLRTVNLRVPLRDTPCHECGAQEPAAASGRGTRRTEAPPRPRPVVSFSVSTDNLTATVDASETTPALGVIFSHDWGDGSVTEAPSHTYSEAGTYTITVSARNTAGPSRLSRTITVTPPPPVVSFTVSTNYLTVLVDTSRTRPTSGVTFAYDWGDGKTSPNRSHTYKKAGTYTVSVTATSAAGSSTERRTKVRVAAPPPVVAISVSASYLTATVDTSRTRPTSGVTFAYSWGDGLASQTPSHTYRDPGTYKVFVTGFNSTGTSFEADVVTVWSPPPPDLTRRSEATVIFAVVVVFVALFVVAVIVTLVGPQ